MNSCCVAAALAPYSRPSFGKIVLHSGSPGNDMQPGAVCAVLTETSTSASTGARSITTWLVPTRKLSSVTSSVFGLVQGAVGSGAGDAAARRAEVQVEARVVHGAVDLHELVARAPRPVHRGHVERSRGRGGVEVVLGERHTDPERELRVRPWWHGAAHLQVGSGRAHIAPGTGILEVPVARHRLGSRTPRARSRPRRYR